MNKKTCFVIIGYGIKDDYPLQRKLDLGRSYENLIKPAFDELNIDCFRAIDRNYQNSGLIDTDMFGYILKADLVVADVSTLNPNAIYELGVRHALRPFSTIIIADEQTVIPFDFGRNAIVRYKHLGEDIGVSEAARFKEVLKQKVQAVLDESKIDSPVYTFLSTLIPPTFNEEELTELVEVEREFVENQESLTELIDAGESALKARNWKHAKEAFQKALKIDPNDLYLKQRIILITYKSQEPNSITALTRALELLAQVDFENSASIETIGLTGAIYKRLFEATKTQFFLEESIRFYRKGYYIQGDYYNGINLAFLHTLHASLPATSDLDALIDYELANRIRKELAELCRGLIASENFHERSDINWIYLTLAEVYFALKEFDLEQKILEEGKEHLGDDFSDSSYAEQREKLGEYIRIYSERIK